MSFPNLLTILRMLMVPVFATAFIYRQHNLALGIFIAAAITDALDGLLARVTSSQTRLGTFLDPIADKLLMLTAFIILGVGGEVPVWALVLILSREVVIVGGWMIRNFLTRNSTVVPSMLGKATTFMQIVCIVCLLLTGNFRKIHEAVNIVLYVTMGFTALSGLDYLNRGMKELEKRT